MQRRQTLTAFLVLIALLLTLWYLDRGKPNSPDDPLSGGVEDEEVPAEPLLRGSEQEPGGEAPEEPKRPSPAEALARGAHRAPSVTGTVRYEDGTAAGAFRFTLWRRTGPGSGGGWQIEGTEGTFEGPSVAPGRYEIRKMQADGGEPAVVDPSVTYVRGELLEVVIRRGQNVRLRVLDAESGRELPDARAHRDRGSLRIPPIRESALAWLPSGATLHSTPEAADGRGIIVLPPVAEVAHWLVGAPHHAWQRLDVPASSEEVIIVRLSAGGTAVVNVPDLGRAKDPVLIVDQREELPERITLFGVPPQADDAGTFRIEGLPEGLLTFAVGRLGGFVGVAQVYASGRVEIRRGTEAHLTLQLDLGPPRKKVVLQGAIHIPEAWRRSPQPWQLFFRGAAGDERTAGYRAEARLMPGSPARPTSFETDALPEGDYEFLLKPLYWIHRVTARDGMAPLEIMVPPPVRVRVRVIDAETGRDVSGAHLQYAPTIDTPTSWRWHNIAVDDETLEHVFRCPASRVRLSATAPGYQARVEDVEPREVAEETFVVELVAAGLLRLQLRHRGRPVSAKGVLIWVSSAALSRGATGRDEVLELDGLAPGEWTVKVKKIAGYRLPPLQTVTVEAGKPVMLTIDLEADDG